MQLAVAVAIGAGAAVLCGPTSAWRGDASGVGSAASSSPLEHLMQHHPYLGMWVTGDGRIRQELLPTGRYDEARGTRKSAYQGRYEVEGNRIQYWDDTGFTADGTFVTADELHHDGMVFYRETGE
ncbi:Atu4866 domain-containing protein [Xanthomonas campestris pv. incanae]|nr:Atu4866 domain-containing protein [Xanthomonas campestris]MCC5093069.1 Atu4866 domain-containing protein [Xanthomonas campestris pv. incanae]MEA9609251.1 Atu4866 domain-containing protein [Xanthomonas campestris pv. incanae]MEA9617709.1 Atu4866 domain-containing protein [Xanthomonas campestris pv. incanae]WDJ11967.1 Atu4866 domain-containing protein [Xanthomonas campestris pv. incanae]